jgi:hypothetical protein
MKVQGRLASFVEANMNVMSGFFISWMVWLFVVAPLFNYDTGFFKGFLITSIFTVSSLLRAYIIRRIVNWHTERKLHERYEFVEREEYEAARVSGRAGVLSQSYQGVGEGIRLWLSKAWGAIK